jgi:hypothetical protein
MIIFLLLQYLRIYPAFPSRVVYSVTMAMGVTSLIATYFYWLDAISQINNTLKMKMARIHNRWKVVVVTVSALFIALDVAVTALSYYGRVPGPATLVSSLWGIAVYSGGVTIGIKVRKHHNLPSLVFTPLSSPHKHTFPNVKQTSFLLYVSFYCLASLFYIPVQTYINLTKTVLKVDTTVALKSVTPPSLPSPLQSSPKSKQDTGPATTAVNGIAMSPTLKSSTAMLASSSVAPTGIKKNMTKGSTRMATSRRTVPSMTLRGADEMLMRINDKCDRCAIIILWLSITITICLIFNIMIALGLQYRSAGMVGVVFVGLCLSELAISAVEIRLISASVEKV